MGETLPDTANPSHVAEGVRRLANERAQDVPDAAKGYLERGWCVLPLCPPWWLTKDKSAPLASAGKKPQAANLATWERLWARPELWTPERPTKAEHAKKTGNAWSNGSDWQHLRLTPDALPLAFADGCNLGVNLGKASGGLADVDLDTPEALELAARFLPPTWTFGRPGKPRSHWLYQAPGAVLEQFRDLPPAKGKTGATLVELRAEPRDGSGAQTVLPPSTYRTGEQITWAEDCDSQESPTTVDPAELRSWVALLAEACLLLRHCDRAAVLAYLDGTAPYPTAPAEVLKLARQWRGLPQTLKPAKPWKPNLNLGDDWIADVNRAGPLGVAQALGFEANENWIAQCPACEGVTRSRKDKRIPVAIFAAKHGPAWIHRGCGEHGDALAFAAWHTLGRVPDKGEHEAWAKLRAECASKGLCKPKPEKKERRT
jgi:hypothetical protein